MSKPKVKLIGEDGNVFAIIGKVAQAAIAADWTEDKLREVLKEMTSDDYDNALSVAQEYFDIT